VEKEEDSIINIKISKKLISRKNKKILDEYIKDRLKSTHNPEETKEGGG
jgi:hypothetical protein